MPLPPGTLIGEYEILSSLGAGSMGEVYRARDPRLDRDVAIKVLPELFSLNRDRLLRFEQEAKAAAALNHPNILAVYRMGTFEGTPYIVTEFLEGRTLTECIRRGPLPLRKAIDYAIQIARGLAAAHDKGILHRDLKPDNLFITKDDHVKILDFGLAKFTRPKEESPANLALTITSPGVALGTIGYMAPEQVRGFQTDHRADIFAFGAIFYEMVMGRNAFERKTSADTVSAILNDEPASISQLSPDIPVAVERLIRRCLEKNPEQRFQSASDLAFALEALSQPGTSSASRTFGVATNESRPKRWLQGAIAVTVLLVIALASYFLFRSEPSPRVSNYTQLTHDGQQKAFVGTDGARIYLSLGEVRAGSFAFHGIAQISTAGGAPNTMSMMPAVNMFPIDLSPDGSRVLAIDGEGAPPKGPLWSLEFLRSSPRRLGDIIAETAAWSPDAKMVAYSVLGNLFLAKADGTDSHQLATVSGDILNVAWSPDGSRLRFDCSESVGTVDQHLQWEVSVSGKDLHRLFEGWHNPPDECCGRWTPDGKYFVFQSGNQIWAIDERPGILRSRQKPFQLTASPLSLSTPLPSKDGKKLFIIGQIYRGELMRFDAKSGQFSPFLNGISAEYVDFSKDGQWVTYVNFREGTLWRSKVDGSERLQLTYSPLYPVLPRWSPDGKNILFFEFPVSADKPARMYEVSANGGSPRPLLPDDRSQQLDPNWSPDGSKIVYAGESNDPSSSIHVLDLTTHQVSSLPASEGLFSPRWSPDSRYLSAFSADSKTLLLFDFQTQKWSPLAQGSLSWLNWSHDSKYVYVLDFLGRDAVVRIRVSDRKIEQVIDLKNFITVGRYGGWLALTPDDSPLLLRDTGSQDVYSVDWESR